MSPLYITIIVLFAFITFLVAFIIIKHSNHKMPYKSETILEINNFIKIQIKHEDINSPKE